MTAPVVTLRDHEQVGDAREMVISSSHNAFPIVDDQRRCVGIVTRGDLLGPDAEADASLLDVGSDVVTVTPDDTMLTVLERLLDEGIEHVPVVDTDLHIVGICTRTNVLRAREPHREADRHQPGWHDQLRRRREPADVDLEAAHGKAS